MRSILGCVQLISATYIAVYYSYKLIFFPVGAAILDVFINQLDSSNNSIFQMIKKYLSTIFKVLRSLQKILISINKNHNVKKYYILDGIDVFIFLNIIQRWHIYLQDCLDIEISPKRVESIIATSPNQFHHLWPS